MHKYRLFGTKTAIFGAVFITFLGLISSKTQAADAIMTGNELVLMCDSKYDVDAGFCAGYVSAVAHAMSEGQVSGFHACHLEKIRSQQYMDIFKAYVSSQLPDMNTPAQTLVAAALSRAFPCNR